MQLPEITIQNDLNAKWPVSLGLLLAQVEVVESLPALDDIFDEVLQNRRAELEDVTVGQLPVISATRKAYKAYGKDPSRYRPSAEALLRRVMKGDSLYRINNVVDLLNLVSIQTGISIGGYNLEKIEGEIQIRIGLENEPYQAIGRGELNMGGLPVLADSFSAFGCPTSDSVRTSVTNDCRYFLMVLFDFEKNHESLKAYLSKAKEFLAAYGKLQSEKILQKIIS